MHTYLTRQCEQLYGDDHYLLLFLIHRFLASFSKVAAHKVSWSPNCSKDLAFSSDGTVTEEDERGGDRGGWEVASIGSTSSVSNYVITPLGSSTITNSDDGDGGGCVDDGNDEGCKTPTQQGHSAYTALLHSGKPLGLSSPSARQERMVAMENSPKTNPSEHVRTRPPRQARNIHLSKTVNVSKYHHHQRQLFPLASTPPSTRARGAGLGYPLYSGSLRGSQSSSADARSSVTTSSELDFRKDLATLDADIARLQVQFQVALQPN